MSKTILLIVAVCIATTVTLTIDRVPAFLPATAAALVAPPSPNAVPAAAVEVPFVDPTSAGFATPAQLSNGARVYRTLCLACHLPDGKGMTAVVPPLAGADFLFDDRERAIRIVLKGISGPITVNSVGYNGIMPPLEAVLSDRQIADVLTYVYNSWGNEGAAFDPDFVATLR